MQLLEHYKATHVFGNIEYEVDELRRDIKVAELCAGSDKQAIFIADKLVVEPGKLKTQQGKAYGVYSPWLRCERNSALAITIAIRLVFVSVDPVCTGSPEHPERIQSPRGE